MLAQNCVQSNHDVDEVLEQSKLPQDQPQCGSADCVERFHKVDEEGVGGEVVLLALAECDDCAETAINRAAIASKAGLLLEPLLLLDKVQTSHDYAREYLRCDVEQTDCSRSPILALCQVSLLWQKFHACNEPLIVTLAKIMRLQCCPMRSTQAGAQ
jgi:hypothetical protein